MDLMDERDAHDSNSAGMPSMQGPDLRARPTRSSVGRLALHEPEEVLVRMRGLREALGMLRDLPPRRLGRIEGTLWGEPDVMKIECKGGCGWGVAWRKTLEYPPPAPAWPGPFARGPKAAGEVGGRAKRFAS